MRAAMSLSKDTRHMCSGRAIPFCLLPSNIYVKNACIIVNRASSRPKLSFLMLGIIYFLLRKLYPVHIILMTLFYNILQPPIRCFPLEFFFVSHDTLKRIKMLTKNWKTSIGAFWSPFSIAIWFTLVSRNLSIYKHYENLVQLNHLTPYVNLMPITL